MKVVVTGGAGYIGWSTVNELLAREGVSEVIVFDNFRRANYSLLFAKRTENFAKLRVHQDDLLNSRGLRKALNGADAVCHLAAVARSPYSHESPHEFDQINHWGTAELCYAVEDLGIGRLVYISSGAVYGQGNTGFSSESPVSPISSYGDSKLAGERQVERLKSCTKCIILRAGTVYGLNPCVRFDTAVNKFSLQAVLGKTLHINGDGRQRRAIIHVDDIARLLANAVLGEVSPGTYNAVTQNPSIIDIVEKLKLEEPTLEFTFVNQNQRMNSLVMSEEANLALFLEKPRMLSEELKNLLDALGHSRGVYHR